jgi:hypothetical protein
VNVATSTHAYTRVHTAAYLAEVVMGAIGDILAVLGIDTTRFTRDFAQDEVAISNWIAEGSLAEVALECHRPDGTVRPVLEFPIKYDVTGTGDARFVNSRAALARYTAKLKSVPRGTTYQLFCSFNGSHSTQYGWGPGTRASTKGLRSTSFGSLAEGPHASASMRMRD